MIFNTEEDLYVYLDTFNSSIVYAIYRGELIAFNKYKLDTIPVRFYLESDVSISRYTLDFINYEYDEHYDATITKEQYIEYYYTYENGYYYATEVPQTVPFIEHSDIKIDNFYNDEHEAIRDNLAKALDSNEIATYG